MAQVKFNKALGIASLSGRLGNLIFYNRKGQTYVRSVNKNCTDFRGVFETSPSHTRDISEADDGLKTEKQDEP